VRHCPSKAIKVKNGSASVMPELCVACGICYQVCPAGAKQIRSDVARAKRLLSKKRQVFASIAPSWLTSFENFGKEKLIKALKKLGFAGVSETALGAEQVSSMTNDILEKAPNGIFISSACPAAVDYIKKYIPKRADNIMNLLSPLLVHCKLLRKEFGDDIGIVFFGPCIAKKQEADNHPELLDIVLTFEDLKTWLEEEHIKPELLPDSEEEFALGEAEEGKLYPIEGGMLDTIRSDKNDNVIYMTLSGLLNIESVLSGDGADNVENKIIVECLACNNGCINGPVIKKSTDKFQDIIRIAREKNKHRRTSAGRKLEVDLNENIKPSYQAPGVLGDDEIKIALAKIGKYKKDDELNCGGCGYQTCRDFARALIEDKAEVEMCVSHLKKLSQKKANALIKYIPAGVAIVDNNLKIIECNRLFATMFDDVNELAYDAMPGLKGVKLEKIVGFKDLFQTTLEAGGEFERKDFVYGNMILNINMFTIEKHRVVGAIIQDVTKNELHREQIAEKARDVIQKNIITVQTIANCLGEHMADTEILLREVARGYQKDKKQTPLKGKPEDDD
jgi:iron only hydrogenase large subunit-like protein